MVYSVLLLLLVTLGAVSVSCSSPTQSSEQPLQLLTSTRWKIVGIRNSQAPNAAFVGAAWSTIAAVRAVLIFHPPTFQ
jgi:hypothetical protein